VETETKKRPRLSPNDCREETGWPPVKCGGDISPPNTSSAAVANETAPSGDAGKVARIEEHRKTRRPSHCACRPSAAPDRSRLSCLEFLRSQDY
jgi:hypothetical protein